MWRCEPFGWPVPGTQAPSDCSPSRSGIEKGGRCEGVKEGARNECEGGREGGMEGGPVIATLKRVCGPPSGLKTLTRKARSRAQHPGASEWGPHVCSLERTSRGPVSPMWRAVSTSLPPPPSQRRVYNCQASPPLHPHTPTPPALHVCSAVHLPPVPCPEGRLMRSLVKEQGRSAALRSAQSSLRDQSARHLRPRIANRRSRHANR